MSDPLQMSRGGRPLVLYDGLCGFCDVSVRWLLTHDTAAVLRFSPLQGDAAAEIRARHPELPGDLDSIVFVEGEGAEERVAWHSLAIWRICRHLPLPWRVFSVLTLLPRPLTDLAYRAFARIRYRIWGHLDTCRLPSPAERARFLA